MGEQVRGNSDRLKELMSNISPNDVEIICNHMIGKGSKKLFVELCKNNPSFWNSFMHELNKHDNVSFEDTLLGAQLALGILSRRAKIEYLNDTLIDRGNTMPMSEQTVHSKLSK